MSCNTVINVIQPNDGKYVVRKKYNILLAISRK